MNAWLGLHVPQQQRCQGDILSRRRRTDVDGDESSTQGGVHTRQGKWVMYRLQYHTPSISNTLCSRTSSGPGTHALVPPPPSPASTPPNTHQSPTASPFLTPPSPSPFLTLQHTTLIHHHAPTHHTPAAGGHACTCRVRRRAATAGSASAPPAAHTGCHGSRGAGRCWSLARGVVVGGGVFRVQSPRVCGWGRLEV